MKKDTLEPFELDNLVLALNIAYAEDPRGLYELKVLGIMIQDIIKEGATLKVVPMEKSE